jgi:tryptophan synthase beta chain
MLRVSPRQGANIPHIAAKKAKEEGREKVILFNYSGHGLMDLAGYQAYFAGQLENYPLPPEVLERSLGVLEGLLKP